MKRYNVLPPTVHGSLQAKELRVTIVEADNGEWVRYEDVLLLEKQNEIHDDINSSSVGEYYSVSVPGPDDYRGTGKD